MATRYQNFNNPIDLFIFKLRDVTLWLDSNLNTPTIFEPFFKESAFVGLYISDLRFPGPLYGLEDQVFYGCMTYGVTIEAGKKVGDPYMTVGGLIAMQGEWNPGFVSHKRLSIRNVQLGVDAAISTTGFKNFAGTLRGAMDFCTSDFSICVSLFSETQVDVAFKQANFHINFNASNLQVGDILAVASNSKALTKVGLNKSVSFVLSFLFRQVLPKALREAGIEYIEGFFLPVDGGPNATGLINFGYSVGFTTRIALPDFLSSAPGSANNNMLLSLGALVFTHCDGSGLIFCNATANLNFNASVAKPLNLGVPGVALVTLSAVSNSSAGPFWTGAASAT